MKKKMELGKEWWQKKECFDMCGRMGGRVYVENVVEGGQRKRESEKEEKMKKMNNKIVLYPDPLYFFLEHWTIRFSTLLTTTKIWGVIFEPIYYII